MRLSLSPFTSLGLTNTSVNIVIGYSLGETSYTCTSIKLTNIWNKSPHDIYIQEGRYRLPRICASLWDLRLGNITVPSVTCSRILVEATLEITLSRATFPTHLFIPVIFVKWPSELEPVSLCTGQKSTGMGSLFKYFEINNFYLRTLV